MPPDGAIRQAAASLRLLADPPRMKILWVLAQGESNVSCLAELAGVPPTGVSQHLAKLRLAGLVTARARRNLRFYSVADRHVGCLLGAAVDHADHDHPEVALAVAALSGATGRRTPR